MSNFDTEKFRKVYTLVKKGATAGEREAAKSAATRIASKAGMTFQEAIRKIEVSDFASTATDTSPSSPFEDFFNQPEFKAVREKRERENASKRSELLKKYGSIDAIFAETDREILLSNAVDHLKIWEEYIDTNTGKCERYVSSLDGCEYFWSFDKMTPSVLKAVTQAYPVPSNLDAVLLEYQEWGQLYQHRYLFDGREHSTWVSARVLVLEKILNTRPVQNWRDMQARMGWWQEIISWEMAHHDDWEEQFHARMADDLEFLRKQTNASVQSGQPPVNHRTNADKGADIREMISKHPDLSNREIARRLGVSPQSVINWRSRMYEMEVSS